MGFFDKVKKTFGSKKEDAESQNSNENIVNDEIIDKTTPNEKIKNFKYLDDLIHSGTDEIVLDFDIVLKNSEKSEYQNGIELDANNIIIDGNGHTIDAKGLTRIFHCSTNAILRNLTLINGFNNDGAAINIEDSAILEIINCNFKSNFAQGNGGAIMNSGKLMATGNNFINNTSHDLGGAIVNTGEIKIINCEFRENSAKTYGGAIINFDKISIKGGNFIKNSARQISGGAINNQGGQIILNNSNFEENTANEYGGAIFNYGKMDMEKVNFTKNSAQINGGALSHQNDEMTIIGCEFRENVAKEAGAIINSSKINIRDVKFTKNATQINGAAISNQGEIDLSDSEFEENLSQYDGSIINFGKISLKDANFIKNSSQVVGGAINNQPNGEMALNNCEFIENVTREYGGAIINFGKMNFNDANFTKNTAKVVSGGAINNQGSGEMVFSNCKFDENSALSGGAISNSGKIGTNATKFMGNVSRKDGGAICNMRGSVLNCSECEFKGNESEKSGSSIYNESRYAKFDRCEFIEHGHKVNVVFNKNSMTFNECRFKGNSCLESIIFSDVDSTLEVFAGSITDNSTGQSALHSKAQILTIQGTSFHNNTSSNEYSADILNEGNLTLHSPKFKTEVFTVLNKCHVTIKKLPHAIVEKTIFNAENGSVEEDCIPEEPKQDFTFLNNLIRKSSNGIITLESDISLENYEADFFEGGIEIEDDNIIIEGNNHVIDAGSRTRIFHVLAKNVVMKNLTFKNGQASNRFEMHISGGGAIKTIQSSSLTLENCEFNGCLSDGGGGAILNYGVVNSKTNTYINNVSKFNGGAILNNGTLYTTMDTFEKNRAVIAGAIYNGEKLFIDDEIDAFDNHSDIKEQIYNADTINTKNISIDEDELIYNTGTMNKPETSPKSFGYLKYKFESSSEIILGCDIKVDYNDLRGNDEINLDGELIFDGNGHIIDLNHLNPGFKVKGNTTFKNVTFKNGDMHRNSLFEISSNVRFENVKFLNNQIRRDNCLIENRSNGLELTNSAFYNNTSKSRALISNAGGLTVDNTDFLNNNSRTQGTVIYNHKDNKDTVLIRNSNFAGNTTNRNGGAICAEGKFSFEIIGTRFIKNRSGVYGGAIINQEPMKLVNCIFIENLSNTGGALHNIVQSVLEISGCEFNSNASMEDGGAISNFGKITSRNTSFAKNSSQRNGGAINNQSNGELIFIECEFTENESYENGGAIYNLINSALCISDSRFISNTSTGAGAAILNFGKVTALNAIFSRNFSKLPDGGTINNQKGDINFTQCEFSNNIVHEKDGVIYTSNQEAIKYQDCIFKDND